MTYFNIREEELKNKIAQDYFDAFDCSRIVGNIDFCVTIPTVVKSQQSLFEVESLLWAEAKKNASDIYKSITQLILTIGKARTFDKSLPPAFLGAFDAEKIAFVPYNEIHDIFYQNDFNWSVTSSNTDTKEFKQVLERVTKIIDAKALLYQYGKDDKDLKKFIKNNFISGKTSLIKTRIDKNNFMVIYNKWLQHVKPSISFNWNVAKKDRIIDGDFYLADLLSSENVSLKENLYVVLKATRYELNKHKDEYGAFTSSSVDFNDKQKAHTQFWNKYERPPKEEYWDYIVERRDLLVPQDVRERKGSYFTPQIWVELSQKYLTDVLDEDWQDEYTIWDCAAGTGNLLTGLTNKYNIWASTLDKQDVDVMHDRIKNGANLLEEHVFQFDFLNDDFDKLPAPLKAIIDDEEKRKKLVVYINPPYVEGDSRIGKGRKNIQASKIHDEYADKLEDANRELFAQFLIRIFYEIDGCIIGEFSKLKTLTGSHFKTFRNNFRAKLVKGFIVPSWTFDNVKGKFPIGFKIWFTSTKEIFKEIKTDIFLEDDKIEEQPQNVGQRNFYSYAGNEYFSKWVNAIKTKQGAYLGWLARITLNDFQSNETINILNTKNQLALVRGIEIHDTNLIKCCICFAVRKCIEATWLNDRDQFLYPNDSWQTDIGFQNDCFAYTLFSNNIQSKYGTNNWIPFTEQEVNAKEKFESNFMTNFIKGKLRIETSAQLFNAEDNRTTPLQFSKEATDVFKAGKDLWMYYHAQPDCNVNAALYDIREYFQGRNDKGKMNNRSKDEQYTLLIAELRLKLKDLAKKIEPKVFEYGFLK